MADTFRAVRVTQHEGQTRVELTDLPMTDLPEGDVTVRISHSTLNYKDALALTGRRPIVKRFPMVPGIDFAGVVEQSTDPEWLPGDQVILNGWGVGEAHFGGLAQYARVRGEWLIPRPKAFSPAQAMAIGTAGYTAMLCVMALEAGGVAPGDGEVLVTGAAGGVGSVAIALLSKLGYRVIASTGRPAEAPWLKALGAADLIDRASLSEPGKPVAAERWAGVIDAVGSHTLANALAQTRYGGAVAACGLAQGFDLPTTVFPFILRGVTLYGIDSVNAPRDKRQRAWGRLARDLDPAVLARLTSEHGLAEVPDLALALLGGQVRGRLVVDVNR